ncbi:MAG: hypothetical protein FWF79_02290 [Defluviitaleaceae bacterium]|nr:hypothetical protein [Defluviitaleaceae bacterium]
MNPSDSELENNKTIVENTEKKPEPSKRTYTRKDKRVLTFADVTAVIQEKAQEIANIQNEIEGLIAKRNELFFLESQEMGIVSMMQDPNSASRLAGLIKESANKRH